MDFNSCTNCRYWTILTTSLAASARLHNAYNIWRFMLHLLLLSASPACLCFTLWTLHSHGWLDVRAAEQISARQSSAPPLPPEAESIPRDQSRLLLAALCLICSLAPENLDALISLDAGVLWWWWWWRGRWGGHSVCLSCIPDIPELPPPALCFLCPAAPSF